MIVRFNYKLKDRILYCTFNTTSNRVFVRDNGSERCVPLNCLEEDLRVAAVRAKVDLLRFRAGQFNPLLLQEMNHEQETKNGPGPSSASAIEDAGFEGAIAPSIGMEQSEQRT